MAISLPYTANDGEVPSGANFMANFNQIINNPVDLWSPALKSADMNGFELIMDADADSSLTADTDDRLDVRLNTVDLFYLDGTTSTIANFHMRGAVGGYNNRISDVNGNEIVECQGVASAVNQIGIVSAATTARPRLDARGETNVSLALRARGTGEIIHENANGNNIGWCPLNYLSGLTLSRISTTQIQVAAGLCRDSSDATNIRLTAALGKTTSAWSVGGGAGGGLDGALPASAAWYNVFLIYRSDTGAVDVGFDAGATPTLPTGYDYYRRIGSVRTDATPNFILFVQSDDTFLWDVTLEDVDATPNSTAAQTVTLTVPTGQTVQALIRTLFIDPTGTGGAVITSLNESDQAPSASAAPGVTHRTQANGENSVVSLEILTNTSAQIRYRMEIADADASMRIWTYGWIDRRGR